MSMATSMSVPLARRLRTSRNYLFLWLDESEEEFLDFSQKFCKVIAVDRTQWHFFQRPKKCARFLADDVVPPKRAILITCGSLGLEVIQQIHNATQLDSIYVYCLDLPRYQHLSDVYSKVLGVLDNPVALSDKLQLNFEKRPSLSAPPPAKDEPVPRIFVEEIPWSPWESRCPSCLLLEPGQATIIIRQTESIPFRVILSNASDLIGIQCKEQYSVIVHVRKCEVTIGTLINGQVCFRDSTSEPSQVLQIIEGNEEQTYWICLSRENRTVTFGIGEMRPRFRILEAQLEPRHEHLISQISHLHVTIKNVWKDFSTIEGLRNKIHFFQSSARLVEPALILRPSSQSGLSLQHLSERCRELYYSLDRLKLVSDDFPDLIEAIELSLQSPHGWCHQRLAEKARLFGRHQNKMSYLRLTLDRFVIEIWPPGHSSPIHHHPGAFGMFRVLRGSLLIHLFPSLSLTTSSSTTLKYLLRQGEATWMSPRWNQTHQMENVESHPCILVQCYDNEHFHPEREPTREFFHYIDTHRRMIRAMQPTSDMSFGEFEEKIKNEWNHRSIT